VGRASSPLRDRLIFLVGARRSGTNWLQRILGTHPDVFSVPSETTLFSNGLAPFAERIQHDAMSSPRAGKTFMDREAMLDALRDLCDAVFAGVQPAGSTRQRILERTPDHVHHLSLIGPVYPDAHVIHIVRDGRDVARSLVSQPWGPESLAEAAEQWRDAVEAGRRDAHHVPNLMEVRYEDLLADPATWVPKLFGWLGLRSSADTVASALAESGVRFNVDAGATQIGAGKWRDSFTPTDLEDVMGVARPLLVELGYEVDAGASGPPRPAAPRPRRRSLRRRSAPRSGRQRVREGLAVTERLLAALRSEHPDLGALLHDRAHVRIITDDDEREAHGTRAVELLHGAIAGDEALRGRQVRGDVHPSVPSYTFVGTFEADGMRHDRVLVVSVRDGLVGRCAYYMRGGRPL
jgi:hypothetical protein